MDLNTSPDNQIATATTDTVSKTEQAQADNQPRKLTARLNWMR